MYNFRFQKQNHPETIHVCTLLTSNVDMIQKTEMSFFLCKLLLLLCFSGNGKISYSEPEIQFSIKQTWSSDL